MKGNAIFRVRDWKGYGIVQQCGTCEPLQSRTLAGCRCQPVQQRAVVTHRR